MTHPPDKQQLELVLRQAAEGDERAWRTVVDIYGPRVFGLLRAQCGNADLAEEIAQSTFCTVAAKIGAYSEIGKFEAWLFRIAMNRLRDEMRRRKRQAKPVEDKSLAALADTGRESPLEALDPAALDQLRRAVAHLSDAEQRIIHLRWFAQLSFKQIADLLEQPLGTVLARHHRALKRLKEALSPGDQESTP